MTAGEWDDLFETMETWFAGSLGDKKRFAYRLSPINEQSYRDNLAALKFLANSGQKFVPAVAEMIEGLKASGHHRGREKQCRDCNASIPQNSYFLQNGRCDDCFEIFSDRVYRLDAAIKRTQAGEFHEGFLKVLEVEKGRGVALTATAVARKFRISERYATELLGDERMVDKDEPSGEAA